jgi:HAD superfamily hydrolase (TIGR01509 family)
MINWLAERQVTLRPGGASDDPMRILSEASTALSRTVDASFIPELEALLTHEELLAVDRATPTPGADESTKALAAEGRTLAVASNNSAAAIGRYLHRVGVASSFGGGVHGRAADPALMKPDPDCLRRALDFTGAKPSEVLMIGDSPDDFRAADAVGVPFLGFARHEVRASELRDAGAIHLMSSWKPFLSALGDARQ